MNTKEILVEVIKKELVPEYEIGDKELALAYKITQAAIDSSDCKVRTKPRESIFNTLNGNSENKKYEAVSLTIQPRYAKDKINFNKDYYKQSVEEMKKVLDEGTNEGGVLDKLDQLFSFVPYNADNRLIADISLSDGIRLHAAMTTALVLSGKTEKDNCFRMVEIDISGIQSFIYDITSENALKSLRARSFYLEILMNQVVNKLLDDAGVGKVNILYAGGGRSYILLPNSDGIKEKVDSHFGSTNDWLMNEFGTKLYVAHSSADFSLQELQNEKADSYQKIFVHLSSELSLEKLHRYSPQDILKLNSNKEIHLRECKACQKATEVDENGLCEMCASLKEFSKGILEDSYILISSKAEGVPLPYGLRLKSSSDKDYVQKQVKQGVKVLGKNENANEEFISEKILVGSYYNPANKSFEEMAAATRGIKRIGILRGDVDNLGSAFVSGFSNLSGIPQLLKVASLSRHLSLFFKYYINDILAYGEFSELSKNEKERNLCICYSGGDDIFIVGGWDSIIEASIDIRRAFEQFTQNTLSLSAGIGIYTQSYPIKSSALEIASFEDSSKHLPGKNAVTIFRDGCSHVEDGITVDDGTFKWKEFEEEVLEEKYKCIEAFLGANGERGKNFMYNLLEYIRGIEKDKINLARFVYLLSRLEPDKKDENYSVYQIFSQNMVNWIRNDKDRRQLKVAITIYAYATREKEA